MDDGTPLQSASDSPDEKQVVRCAACESALRSPGRGSLSFLLLDGLTVPLVGCDDHLEEFRTLCGLATDGRADLLDHRPAGGVNCPSCRHAPQRPRQRVIPVGNGGLAVLACETHQSDVFSRFRTGLRVREHLTDSIDAASTDP
ncbi:hypothetical protein [Halorubrum hochsteinianum]|uniref:Uncharacterized protein n=1 Tax=Halorubrum hochstenium ATCC 700873 TaxID=1227481 RepID=M0FDL8_9EURY|nr:hypothetical protein [Halorubrum hochsteinianum]ELZ57433.1 hypothetical protein C467_06774 [Halorubrum hochstenium ATCC 700873]